MEREAAANGGRPKECLTLKACFGEFLEYSEAKGLAESTLRHYSTRAAACLKHFGTEKDVESLRLVDVVQYTRARAKQLTRSKTPVHPHSILHEVQTLQMAYNRAVQLEQVPPRNLIPDELQGAYKPRERTVTPDEMRLLVSQLPGKRIPYVAFLLNTGLRKGEMFALRKPEDFDPLTGCVMVRKGKTRRAERAVPLNAMARYIWDSRPEPVPFPTWTSDTKAIQRACERAGIPPCTMHDLRRTFATTLHQGGAQERVVADLLGHVETKLVRTTYAAKSSLDQLRASLTSPSHSSNSSTKTIDFVDVIDVDC